MIDEILLAAEQSPFAADRYRLQWAIASVLEPDSILQLAGRDRGSERALRDARPSAQYLAVEGATAIEMLPGATWDLIHVDGRQDADHVFRDLEVAIRHGEYVFVDHHHLDRRTFLAVSEFLHRYRAELECHWTIAGPSGHILVKPSSGSWRAGDAGADSGAIRHHYDRDYYLGDCGGYPEFLESRGRRLDDRLGGIAALVDRQWPLRVLDLGCGRGELAAHFARRGAEVSAVDYSAEALELAAECLAASPEAAGRVELVCGDVTAVPVDRPYDAVVAADLVEHLAADELDALCAQVARHLAPTGEFVVHSYPNRWFYEREYPRRRASAAQLGSYLPAEPRSRYEQLMHVNELSPPELEAVLAAHFAHVVVWAGDLAEMRGTLDRARADLFDAAPDLFAVASHLPIDTGALRRAVGMDPLTDREARRIRLTLVAPPEACRVGEPFEAVVRVATDGSVVLNSNEPAPVHLSYHWLDDRGEAVVFEGERTRLLPWVAGPGAERFAVRGAAPDRPGSYVLRLTLVQEGCRWFDADGLFVDLVLEVAAR
jgi:2-polyprenyl-3-methyl-5-hydroxy-6-metoxy-1,4-benzoquinol methylase